MRKLPLVFLVLAAALPVTACGGDDGTSPPSAFELVIIGDPSFQAMHRGQPIRAAVVRGGQVVAVRQGTVAQSGATSFGFTFHESLEAGASHEVHYWIDSNIEGGTAGVCDEPAIDHQWRVDLGTASSNRTITETHRPEDVSNVCATFN